MPRLSLFRIVQPGVRVPALLAACLFFCAGPRPAAAEKLIDYLYVEANEGDSSGGHVGIRFAKEIFHFQHEAPGILRLQRSDAAAFHYAYAMLGNRSIRESTIAVSDDTYRVLRDSFVKLLLVQDSQLEIRDALRRDVALLELLLKEQGEAQPSQEIAIPIGAAGYFLSDEKNSATAAPPPELPGAGAAPSPALRSLRDRIRARYGDLYIAEKTRQARARLRGAEPTGVARSLPPLSPDAFPAYPPTPSTLFEDAARAFVALKLLDKGPRLREGTSWSSEENAFRLSPQQVLVLKRFAAELEEELVRLVDSPRSDWGFPFLLGMARLVAIEDTLSSGRLVLLDLFPPDSRLPPRQDAALRPYLPMMEQEMREVFQKRLKSFFSAERFREAEYAALERSGNLLLDMERGRVTGSPLRGVPKSPFPSREARVSVPRPAQPDREALARELAASRESERGYTALLRQLYGYDLFRHNCVTELFNVVNRAMARAATGAASRGEKVPAQAESEKRLGGYLDPSRGLAFIPIVSAEMVRRSYSVVGSRERPSYRSARVAEMQAREGAFQVFLRESNTITSTVYRPGPGDSGFLFFTDDTLLFRPLFGALNLLAGVGEGLFGLLSLPAQGPERLLSGARGVLFSLPELVFVNLRKGSMAYVENSARLGYSPSPIDDPNI